MRDPFVFDPRSECCKKPYGAVPCGTAVSYTVRPLRAEGWSRCVLVAQREFSNLETETELPCTGIDGDRNRFSGTFPAPAEPELVWYWFRLSRPDGCTILFDKSGWHTDGSVQSWQLTVYEETPTPSWFGQGVTYQIFPDRFCRLSVPDPAGMIGDRWVHENWSDIPEWQPDSQGEVRNRDFFGGSLQGIISKLEDLAAFGVTMLYLNPIFESASNHRYNTADYLAIDPMLGTEADFRQLCREAKSRGIRVILDGVFNHTGSQSRYFNADGFYPEPGAAQSKDSPYYPWYRFTHWPDGYDAWWGVHTLPAVNEECPSYREFIVDGEDSVVRHWLRLGASGWRLDVADELPDDFIADIRAAMEQEKPDSILLGEVWEDGSNKIAYSRRRRYLLGSETHGLMNYPFRTAALGWLTGGDAADFRETMETIRENYPPAAFYGAMNFLGTHDTPRILTLLGARETPPTQAERAAYRLSPEELAMGLARLRLGAMLLFTFPGSPTVYYGDEAGMQGFEDPLNRATYPWGCEDAALLALYRRLGQLRRGRMSLQSGSIAYLAAEGGVLAILRQSGAERTLTALNAGDTPAELALPWADTVARSALDGQEFFVPDGVLRLTLPPVSGMILI